MILGVTGHRLGDKLGGYDTKTRRALGALAVERLYYEQPDEIITGMATGWDQAAAAAAVTLGIPFVAAVPFSGQQRKWPPDAQERFSRLLDKAKNIVVVSDEFVPVNRALQIRNEWVVDRSDKMLALWDGSFGGTHNCIVYARKKGVPVQNVWDHWDADLLELLG